jgi:hypothetical protein
MKKFRYQSLLGFCFIFLFVTNCILLVSSLWSRQPLISVLAIMLALLQIFLHVQFRKKANVWRSYTLGGLGLQLAKIWFPFFYGKKEKEEPLHPEQCVLIRKRSLNKPTQLVHQSKLAALDEYEYLLHYKKATPLFCCNLQVKIGVEDCKEPYLMNILNAGIPAGSANSVDTLFAVSEAAKIEGFTVATGVNGIQPGHIRGGGDLLWQVVLDYPTMQCFANSTDEIAFRRTSSRSYVKMIELFVVGSSKFNYQFWAGEMNPASFRETVGDRGRSMDDLCEILIMVERLKEISGGKPIGLRVPFSDANEMITLSLAIRQTNIYPDFVTIDAELCNTTGTVKMDGFGVLAFARTLFEIHKIPSALIFSGTIVSELDLLKAKALGASACISTKPMIYASQLNSYLVRRGQFSKTMQVANFYRNTISATVKLMEMCRYRTLADVQPSGFYHNSSKYGFGTLEEIYLSSARKGFPPIMNN